MFDIHCHMLPGADDGTKDIDEVLQELRNAQREGVLGVVLTPHAGRSNCASTSEVIHRFVSLKQQAKEAGITTDLYLGHEIRCSKGVLKQLHNDQLLTINQSRYVLLELNFISYKSEYDDIIYELVIAGYIPIIAHVERYSYIMDNPNMVYELIEKGCLIQINQDSIMGINGPAIQKLSYLLLDHHLVHFVCSDAHNKKRPLTLKAAHKAIIHRYSIDYAFELFGRNPLCVIQNQPIIKRLPYCIRTHSQLLLKFRVFRHQMSGMRA